ncbi:ribosomal protein S5 domain 2-like superfamily protein [Actinidia rufa]|uniref:Ribosomal protein S5 domain 2-like superfamily protein n=1 Tax=Actinidia rufa TaxID=165716 RepID=A0A7J0GCJ5_9ERIC|nr:ribosomal protein S5 domain 2-like superfamily protein [Actinidia rufa]
MEIDRLDGRTPNQLRPLACSRNVLNRAHGSASWSQGETKVLAAVYGPKAGTKKNENPEKACIEVIWKPKTGQIGKPEKEYEMILKRTLQSICLLTVNPNTTTSVIVQVRLHDFQKQCKTFPGIAAVSSGVLLMVISGLVRVGLLAVLVCGVVVGDGFGGWIVVGGDDGYVWCLVATKVGVGGGSGWQLTTLVGNGWLMVVVGGGDSGGVSRVVGEGGEGEGGGRGCFRYWEGGADGAGRRSDDGGAAALGEGEPAASATRFNVLIGTSDNKMWSMTMLLPCAINASCAALVDAGIPLKHLSVAICCCLAESGYVILDPNKLEEQKMKAFVYLVFPNSILSVLPEGSLRVGGEPMEHGIITSVTHGVMPVGKV